MRKVFRRRPCAAFVLLMFMGICVGIVPASSAFAAGKSSAVMGPMPAAPQDNPAEPKIAEIVVVGNKVFNAAAIIAFSGHKVGDAFSTNTLDEMKTNIFQTQNFGFNEGGSPDSVKVSAERRNPDGAIKIVIEVDENPRIDKDKIIVTGSGPIPGDEIKKMIHLTTVYNQPQFLRDALDIEERYKQAGYTAGLSGDSGPDPNNPSVLNVSIIVLRVTEIKLAKNVKTKRKTILREMKTKEGDYYNRLTLQKDQSRLYNTGLFEDINIQDRDMGDGKIGLTISLPERRSGQVLAGLGFSNRQQLIGFAQIGETNFRGLAESINLRWESGGITGKNTVELGYFEPWLDKRHTALNAQIYDKIQVRFANTLNNDITSSNNVGNDTRYYEQRTGATFTLSRPFRDAYSAAVSLRGENVRSNALALTPANATILQNGPIGVLGGQLTHDSRDNILDPVIGGYQAFSLQVGYADIRPVSGLNVSTLPGGVFGTTTFTKTQIELRKFISPTGPRKKLDQDKSTLAMRLLLGTSAGRLPFFEQFFIGGTETLRGYREDRFWGKNLFFASAEFRQPLARSLKGVLFLDVGDAWGGSYSGVQIEGFGQGGFHPHVGVGAGIRFRTPIGPLRLDYGIGDEGGRTHFSIGNVF